ncbi:hypothetical protein VPMG_00068 [Vibrio phage VBP32]|uniref:Uncharacterized protein n=2 Tax=Stoningtonvirus VBP47 TaxID=2846606 RepID=M4SP61_9CAUD|nr:hypothetical protein VPNG_00061 [Vibrio phage VBP47]YP_007676558.1 hypothetical protein VPMG_00068 [Vibrio phage VBP32]AGH57085.1 hypothetical protein VPNG_00061 [Vibrio phage VBP47]AGH57207.1 hypothetical protein VPMG_00068 [Vibrio phage VBP32]
MSKCTKVTIEAYKGATVNSPNFFDIEEIASPGTTIADIEAGILDGTYTPVDPNLYTYQGQVKSDYKQALIHELSLTVKTVTIDGTPTGTGTNTYDVVTFKIPPSVTELWDNRENCLLFDIKRTLVADATEVDMWVVGKLEVLPVITE